MIGADKRLSRRDSEETQRSGTNGFGGPRDFRNDIDAAAFESQSGAKKLLVINKRNRDITLQLPPEFAHGSFTTVDVSANATRPAAQPLNNSTLTLPPFAVTLIMAGK